MTSGQLRDLDAAGWDIGNHTRDHAEWITAGLNQSQITSELTVAQRRLEMLGLSRAARHVAYPYGEYGSKGLAAMTATGMLTGRATNTLNQSVLMPGSNYYLNCYEPTSKKDWSWLIPLFESSVARGQFVVLLCHDLSPDTTAWNVADFQSLVDYVAGKGLPCLTIGELFDLQSRAVTIPF